VDTLAFGYILPTTGRITQTSLPRNVRRQAHYNKKTAILKIKTTVLPLF
jgi:uncharacterized protein (UPF0147 family)